VEFRYLKNDNSKKTGTTGLLSFYYGLGLIPRSLLWNERSEWWDRRGYIVLF